LCELEIRLTHREIRQEGIAGPPSYFDFIVTSHVMVFAQEYDVQPSRKRAFLKYWLVKWEVILY
jgi:hypothetical protein